MTQLNLTLPDSLQEYIEKRVEHGNYGTPSDFVRDLIRRDRDQRLAALEAEMVDAVCGGRVTLTPEEVTGGQLVAILKSRLQRKPRHQVG